MILWRPPVGGRQQVQDATNGSHGGRRSDIDTDAGVTIFTLYAGFSKPFRGWFSRDTWKKQTKVLLLLMLGPSIKKFQVRSHQETQSRYGILCMQTIPTTYLEVLGTAERIMTGHLERTTVMQVQDPGLVEK